MIRLAALLLVFLISATAGEPVRIVAANLTSGNRQSYSPDNGNHSNLEGAGARILKALKPDIVLIQEFNTTVPVRQWVNDTFGQEFSFYREENAEIPNGVISRFPILESGEWDDPKMENRDFAWAKIALPDGTKLWAVSVHLYSQKPGIRTEQARALVGFLKERLQPGDRLVIGGDFNTKNRDEDCVKELSAVVAISDPPPADPYGNDATNFNRNKPYDWVLVDTATQAAAVPVKVAGLSLDGGAVFDTRVFTDLSSAPPAQPGDSGVTGMQHMAVVRDFAIPQK